MPNLILCSTSPLKFLGPYFNFSITVIAILAFISHGVSYLLCLFYQYGQADLTRVTNIFVRKKTPLSLFGSIVIFIWVLVLVFIGLVDYVFEPEKEYNVDNEVFGEYLGKIK